MAKSKPKPELIQKHAAEQCEQAKPTHGKTWEMVCDWQENNCDICGPRKKIDTFEPAHVDRRRDPPPRFQDEPSAPAKAAVLKAAVLKAKKETKPPKPPVTVVSPTTKPAVLGERKRMPGHLGAPETWPVSHDPRHEGRT